MRDYLEVIILICFIKLRWAYFHLCPWYCKFSVGGEDRHFQNMKTNTVHSQIIIEFNESSRFYKKQR